MTMDGSTWILVLFAGDGTIDRARAADQVLWLTMRGLPRWAVAELGPEADAAGIATATAAAAAANGVDGFGRRTYVGRRPSDVALARRLGMSFVGLAEGSAADRLARAGAAAILAGFDDIEVALTALAKAPVPS